MPNTYYDSDLTGEQIEAALTAIDGVVTQENNGKVLAIEAGKIVAKSASEWTDTPVLEPLNVTENGDYTPEAGVDGFNAVHVAVSGGGGGTIEPLSVTQNGTYNPPSGVDGYAPVTVSVPSSGGEGPVYYGPSAPDASIGTDEDLYIQYETASSLADHTYKIAAQYRKVNGAWTQYTDPEMSTKGVHIWTKSTGGTDAAMYVQAGYWDINNNTFVATGEVESIIYTSVRNWNRAKDCNGVALLAYPNDWQIKASTTVTDGTDTYQADAIIAQWAYYIQKDIYVYKPMA